MKKYILSLVALMIVTTVSANPNPCNIQPKKRTSYSKYCRINNIKETKPKKVEVKKTSTTIGYLNPKFK